MRKVSIKLKRSLQFIGFQIGVLCLILVLKAFGMESLRSLVPHLRLGWIIFFLYPLICSWDVWAWGILLTKKIESRVQWLELFFIRLAGEAVNNISPVIDIAGEPLKMYLLSKRLGVPKSAAISGTVLAKTSLWISEAVFLLMGSMALFFLAPASSVLRLPLLYGALAIS